MTPEQTTMDQVQELVNHHINHDNCNPTPFLELTIGNELCILYTGSLGYIGRTWDSDNEKINKAVEENEELSYVKIEPSLTEPDHIEHPLDWSVAEVIELFELIMEAQGSTIEKIDSGVEKGCDECGNVSLEDF